MRAHARQSTVRLGDVVVEAVASGNPAERAGVKVGDIVREVDSYDVEDHAGGVRALRMIELRGPGATVKLALERDGKPQTVELQLESPP